MARQIQIRRGTEQEHANFTGAIGEVTMDTTNNTLRVHDGETVGGIILAKTSEIPTDIMSADYVVASQLPTAENNYTWYRRYKSGWIEQGGIYNSSNLTFVIEMADTNYSLFLQPRDTSGKYAMNAQNLTTTGVAINTASGQWHDYWWCVSGCAA